MDLPHPPHWLKEVPGGVLFGSRNAVPMDVWCAERGLPRPTLLDVASERHRRQEKRRQRQAQPGT